MIQGQTLAAKILGNLTKELRRRLRQTLQDLPIARA
jgi:hypothetical protein